MPFWKASGNQGKIESKIMYDKNDSSLISEFENLGKNNKKIILERFKDEIGAVKELIDIQNRVASFFIGFWLSDRMPMRKGQRELMPVLFSMFHRNFYSFFSVLKLTSIGLFSSARPILRHIFESLIVAKFCNINDDFKILKKWYKNETIYFTNSILKKIISPNPQPFFDFWEFICEQSHSTKYSSQIWLKLDDLDFIDISENFYILIALLECNYHLLNTHLITQELDYKVKFYTTRARPKIRDYEIPYLRKKAHRQFKINRGFFSSDSIKLISAYKRKWAIK